MTSMKGELTTDPQYEDIPFHEVLEKYRPRDHFCQTLAKVSFKFRFEPQRPSGYQMFGRYPDPIEQFVEVEIHGEMASQVQNLRRGDKCILKTKTTPSRSPVYPDEIIIESE